ncbi:HEAT repeat domain-containing protein [Thermostilla marina]
MRAERHLKAQLAPLVLAIVLAAGCSSFSTLHLPFDDSSQGREHPAATETEASPSTPAGSTNDRPAESAKAATEISLGPWSEDRWHRAVPPQVISADTSQDRILARQWQHEELEQTLRLPPDQRPDFVTVRRDEQGVARIQAAIALAHLNKAEGISDLVEAVGNRGLRLPLRCAAAEALGLLPPAVAGEPLLSLAERWASAGAPGYTTELHAALVRAASSVLLRCENASGAAEIRRRLEPVIARALDSESPEVLTTALEYICAARPSTLPAGISTLVDHAHPKVRSAALEALAVCDPEIGRTQALRMLADYDLQVRLKAVDVLGHIRHPECVAELRELLNDRSPVIAAAAARSLINQTPDMARELANDKRHEIRRAVAESLSHHPEAANLLSQLIRDPVPSVALAAVATATRLPASECDRMLFTALASDSLIVRREASKHLAVKHSTLPPFPWNGPAELRRAALEELKPILTADKKTAGPMAKTETHDKGSSSSPTDALEHAWRELADEHLASNQRRAIELRLTHNPRASLAAIERLVFEQNHAIATSWVPLLKRLIPEYQAAELLAASDLGQRRQVAGELAKAARQQPLSRLVLKHIVDHLRHESDPMVWQTLVDAASTSNTPEAAAVNEAALVHPIADIRRRGCVYFRKHPDLADPQKLLPLVNDESDSVAVAAIDALGRVPDDKTLPAISAKLASPNKAIALAAATALARVRNEQGLAALERWAYDPDAVFRREVAQCMAEVGDRTFLGTLVMLLDDEDESVRLTALRGLESTWPDVASQISTADETPRKRMAAWRTWYRQSAAAKTLEETVRR